MCNIWCRTFTQKLPPLLPDSPKILEAGARIVNGTVKDYFNLGPSGSYTGIDIIAGEGVDFVLDVCDLHTRFEAESFDAVISTEMLEHCQNWRESVIQMLRLVKVGGYLMITTRSPGFDLHGYPGDHFRFSRSDMNAIFESAGDIVEMDDDLTLDFPCGIGIIMRRSVGSENFASWAEGLSKIEVTPADSVIFKSGKENLTHKEREDAIISYFTDLVSRREEEIRRLNEGIVEQSEWSRKLALEVKNRDNEIIRLQNLLKENTNWSESLSEDLKTSNAEIYRLQKLLEEQTNWAIRAAEEVKARDAEIFRLMGSRPD